ncbi:adenosylcobinamide-phosphate synthase CbiB [Dyella jiangningensis]|uniref:Cobalamin biosynthesis protein CobD n=1 Tax=Dyella jiangningensis TaxID=1379159 RepID=A0A328P3T7_9GAMM|nr:adenosylcobinamide-phosphate synthase CbiB [Dyella jiangningensis]RAO75656.1 cobalamin biosynthesis protein [Dyella jiangningensis]
MSLILTMVAAVLLDAWLGEPERFHPLVAFGRLARGIESRLYGDRRSVGVLAWCVAVLPIVAVVSVSVVAAPWLRFMLDTIVLYLAIGLRSLGEHAMPVAQALHEGNLVEARAAVGRMVSRDTDVLDASHVAAAASESVLENGNDAVFGALFWFVLLGAPGAVLYRLANTLDAMWGYRTSRYVRFGWMAARMDDVINFLPARLTALSYVLVGDAQRGWRCWRDQAPAWDSPNAGPVMAAGAGALGVQLGGDAPYDGVWERRPALGEGDPPGADTIVRALHLVRRAVVLWLLGVLALSWLWPGGLHA